MSLFDLPSTDVLFSHIFSNLRLLDIWNLRLVSIEFHNLCWDYFIKVCKALSIILQSHHSRDGEFLGFGASINIIRKCKKIKCLEIKGHNSKFFEEILHAIIMNESVILKRVCFIGVNFGSVPVVVLDSFSKRCGELEELEVCYALLNSIHDHFVIKVLEFCKHSLLRLSLRDMLSPLVHPLCLQPLTSLKHLSVSKI